MREIKEFFLELSKSTRITLISCGCFILLTMFILIFFVWFPITPSQRVIENFGRENLVYQAKENEAAAATTTAQQSATVTTTTTTVSTLPETYTKITFTTMAGYLPGVNMQTGIQGDNNGQTVTEAVQTTTVPEQPVTEENTSAETTTPEEVTEPPTSPVQVVTQPPTEAPTVNVTLPPAPTEAPTKAPAVKPTEPPQAVEVE